MTEEQLDRARAEEAWRIACGGRNWQLPGGAYGITAARLAREGWTPPDPLQAEVAKLLDSRGLSSGPYSCYIGALHDLIHDALERGIEIGATQTVHGEFTGVRR